MTLHSTFARTNLKQRSHSAFVLAGGIVEIKADCTNYYSSNMLPEDLPRALQCCSDISPMLVPANCVLFRTARQVPSTTSYTSVSTQKNRSIIPSNPEVQVSKAARNIVARQKA